MTAGHVGSLGLGALFLAGCSVEASTAPTPTAARPPLAQPTSAPTRQVGLVVRVTVPPTPPRRHHARPTATVFVPPKHSYLFFQPASGPPLSRVVWLTGGKLPVRMPLEMVWARAGRKSELSTTIYTGPRGNINVPYTVPMSAPGSYVLEAELNGRVLATASYMVASHAALTVEARTVPSGESLVIRGRHFIPDFKLAFVAYPTVGNSKPVVLGMTRSSRHGTFVFRTTTNKLVPGQYVLRSWSVSDLAAQMSETVFEVTF